MGVPFLDLKAQYKEIKNEIDIKIHEVIDNTAFVMGRYLQSFEDSFAAYQGITNVIGTNSGTSALAAALMAVRQIHHDRFGSADCEVITTSNTFTWQRTSELLRSRRMIYWRYMPLSAGVSGSRSCH